MDARMPARTCLAIVLAAGEGTRMQSRRPKVLHAVAGRSLLSHVLAAVSDAGITAAAVVVGPNQDAVAGEAERVLPNAKIFVQHERRGTAHAVLAAKPALIRPETPERLRAPLADGAAVVVLAFRPADPKGYGRLITSGGELIAIREEADGSQSERAIGLCNGGIMALAGKTALEILKRIGNDNRKGEFYL